MFMRFLNVCCSTIAWTENNQQIGAPSSSSLMEERRHIFSPRLFQSSAPFSHLVIAGDIGIVSGIIGQDAASGGLVSEDVTAQTHAAFDNLQIALEDAGLSLAHLISTWLYLLDYRHFEEINSVYRERLADPYPARTTLQVSALPLGAKVQIEAIVTTR